MKDPSTTTTQGGHDRQLDVGVCRCRDQLDVVGNAEYASHRCTHALCLVSLPVPGRCAGEADYAELYLSVNRGWNAAVEHQGMQHGRADFAILSVPGGHG